MDSEREVMATARKPITDPLAQDYVAWRRGVLWLATVTMSIHALVSFFAWLDDIKVDVDGAQLTAMGLDGVGGILKFVGSALYWRIPLTAVLVFLAARHWADVKVSRRYTRYAGILYFLSAVVLSIIPWTSFVGDATAGAGNEQLTQMRMFFGMMAGLSLFAYVAPVPIGVLSGVVRSSLVLKTLLPESPATGWGAVLYLPIYVLLMVSLLVIVMQAVGGVLLTAGLGCILAGAVVYLMNAKQIVRPCTDAEVTSKVMTVHNRARWYTGGGLLLIAAFALQSMEKLGMSEDDAYLKIAEFGIGIWSGILLMTVVAADFILAVISANQKLGQGFQGTALASDLDRKIEALKNVGLTSFATPARTSTMERPDIR